MKMLEKSLILVLLIGTLYSTYFFLIFAKVKYIEWIVFNACAIWSHVFLLGYSIDVIFKSAFIIHLSLMSVIYCGVVGLYKTSWKGMGILTQMLHLTMLANCVIVIYKAFFIKESVVVFIGIGIGIILFLAFIAFQSSFIKKQPNALERYSVFKGN